MSSTKEYLNYIFDQLSLLEEVSHRAMFGEYLIYYRGKIVGGIYDDRFLLKPVDSVLKLIPDAEYQIPYEGAKPMILAENIEDREFMCRLLNEMYEELPIPKKRKK